MGWISPAAPAAQIIAPSQNLEEQGDGPEGVVVRCGHSLRLRDELQNPKD